MIDLLSLFGIPEKRDSCIKLEKATLLDRGSFHKFYYLFLIEEGNCKLGF